MGWNSPLRMNISSLSNRRNVSIEESRELTSAEAVSSATEPASAGGRNWLFGAYAFLVLWGVAYLVLFFTDRLPS